MENGVPPHFHKIDRISERDLISDDTVIAVIPTFAAPEGAEITYNSGGIARRYKMISGTWKAMALVNVLSASAVFDPASLTDGSGATTTVSLTGAALGDFVQVSFSLDLQGIKLAAWVSSVDTVSVRFENKTGGTINLASGTIQVRVIPASQY